MIVVPTRFFDFLRVKKMQIDQIMCVLRKQNYPASLSLPGNGSGALSGPKQCHHFPPKMDSRSVPQFSPTPHPTHPVKQNKSANAIDIVSERTAALLQ